MTNGSVSKRDISVENHDLSDRQGQLHMKWEEIPRQVYSTTVNVKTGEEMKVLKFLYSE